MKWQPLRSRSLFEQLHRLLAILLALAAVVWPAYATAASDGPYDIHVILPLTGYGAFNGNAQAQTLKVVEGYVNRTGGVRGRSIHFVEVDSQSNPQVDLELTNTILTTHPALVIEGGPATVCKAVAPLYASGPVMWCLSGAFYPKPGGFGFASGVESRLGMETTMRYLRSGGYKRIGIITSTDVAGQEADVALKALLADPANRALNVVAWEHFGPTDLTAVAQIAKIKQAEPDVFIGWSTGTATATILRSFRDVGLTVPFVTSAANQTNVQMQQYRDVLPATYLMYSHPWPSYVTLPPGPLKAGMARYFGAMKSAGLQVDGSTNLAWDAAMILVTALRRIGLDATAAQLRDEVLTLHDYAGPSGIFDFRIGNQRGLDLTDCIMVRWDAANGTWQPASGAGGAPLPTTRGAASKSN